MDPGISSQSRTTNEKQLAELLPSAAANLPGSRALDNNSNQNNNDAMDIHCSSFLPSRERHFNPTYRVANENRAITSHRNSACVENFHNPQTSWLRACRSGRRHSIGIDDFSEMSIFSRHKNFNQEKRPPAFNHSQAPHCSSDTTANSPTVVDHSKVVCQKEILERENENEARNIELRVRNSCNGKSLTQEHFNPAQTDTKYKDKSFMRKSSLNRLDFVDQPSHIAAHKSQATVNSQQSSSEANSDLDHSLSHTSVSSSLTKRKSCLSHRSEKESSGGLSRQGVVPDHPNGGMRKSNSLLKRHEGSLKLRSKKDTNALAHFKKKSLSAGEQDSFTDFIAENKVCLSAQEVHPQELVQNPGPRELSPTLDKDLSKPSVQHNINGISSVPHQLNERPQIASSTSLTCDNSSQISGNEQLPKSCCTVVEAISHSAHSHGQQEQDQQIEGSQGYLDIDEDLLDPNDSMVISHLPHFPVADDLISSENNELAVPSHPNTASHQQEAVIVAGDSSPEIACEALESLSIKSSSVTESDKESVKHPSSILRKKYMEEKREIHGILKNAEDKLACRLLPSILKHRESSEEKDVWPQSDLHSILKKSTSEEDSSNNSPDIRPILKNTSTDDESSGMSSKPKPILKKRTSFSEECSYACFHSGELKPILKKKSINDASEDQPKPILKSRRKSEEAAATTSDFTIGSRPRAYSADRGVKMPSEKKSGDDLS